MKTTTTAHTEEENGTGVTGVGGIECTALSTPRSQTKGFHFLCKRFRSLTVQSPFMNRVAPPFKIESTIIWILQAKENNDGSDRHTGVQSGGQDVIVSTPPAEMTPPNPILEDKPSHGPRGVIDTSCRRHE